MMRQSQNSYIEQIMLKDIEFLEDLPTLLVKDFLLSAGNEAGIAPLVHLIFSKFSKRLKS
jgi:hypothetical protein